MSTPATLSRSQRKRRKKAEKRQASKSPETIFSNDQTSLNSPVQITGQTGFQTPVSNVNKDRFAFQNSSDYVQAVMNPVMNPSKNPGASPVMKFSQQIPSTFQTQNPNVFSPQAVPHYVNMGQSDTPPSWASSLIEDVKTIKAVIPKINSIEETVKSIKSRIDQLETRVSGIETKTDDVEKASTFINNEFETHKADLTNANKKIKELEKQCKSAESYLKTMESKYEKSRDEILDLKSRSMRENLIFYGLKKQNDQENCENLVKEIIKIHLDIDPTNMVFDRAHRLGSRASRQAQPIVVKFEKYIDRERVRQKSTDPTIKSVLKDHNLGIGVQTPQEFRDAKKAFYPLCKEEQDRGNSTRVTGNKMYVNNILRKKFVDGKICEDLRQ